MFIDWNNFENELISRRDEINKAWENDISKADRSHLTKKIITVTRDGKTFKQTVYVNPKDDKKEEAVVGEELSPEVKGMNINKYSDKSLLITGDTYVNIDTLRKIKQDIGVGNWNSKLKGWIFPIAYLEKVLGHIWSGLVEKGEDEKAQAVQNQKNSTFNQGDEANIHGEKGKIEENVSDSEGTKYNISLDDGTKLEGVNEKVMNKEPEKDDKKIRNIVNNTSPESRTKSEKQIYGIKPIKDIHNYSLQEYMEMHGISKQDIDRVINSIKNPKKREGSKTSSGSSKQYTQKDKIQGLTKRQIIGKLVYAHYNAVKKAINDGKVVDDKVLSIYNDLKEAYSKKRSAMSEETKRKISEALKKNKVEETDNKILKKENNEAEDQGFSDINKKDYQPKEGQKISGVYSSYSTQDTEFTLETKDYTDIPPLDVVIPKAKDILNKPKPYFIPNIDEKHFSRNSYTLSAVKLDEDKYLVALDGFEKSENYRTILNQSGNYAIMSLDTFVATQNYYQLKAKEEFKKRKIEDLEKRRERYAESMMRIKGVSKEEAMKMAKDYYKKPSGQRLKILSKNRVTYDQLHMIQNVKTKEDGSKLSRTEALREYSELNKIKNQKSLDLSLQQEYIDSAYTKGAETSFGDSNTKDDLLKDYGVKVKRQNGDEITKDEISQIKEAMDVTTKLFGNNKEMNKEFGLKISHAGEKRMHARRAIGLFHPYYNAIGVSEAYGDNKFQFTFGHEYAHFMDYWIGKQTGNTYASDKEGSAANEIARVFRKNMNKPPISDYCSRTCECFARALEQYTAIETYGDNVNKIKKKYIETDEQVNLEIYKTKIKPLVEKFIDENKEILKSMNLFDILK
jgi:hypothetical protein